MANRYVVSLSGWAILVGRRLSIAFRLWVLSHLLVEGKPKIVRYVVYRDYLQKPEGKRHTVRFSLDHITVGSLRRT